MRISVLGCGWLGLPLAARLAAAGHTVCGSTTSPDKLPRLEAAGLLPFLIDLDNPDTARLPAFCDCDRLIIALPPKGAGNAYPQAIRHLLSATPTQTALILISSTGIYPNRGKEVDESTPVGRDNTPRPHILETETLVRAFTPDHLILRCAGLMGYDRTGLRAFQTRPVPAADAPVNQVHRDDVIEALIQLIAEGATGTYNLCAPNHPAKRELYTLRARHLGLPAPQFNAGTGAFKIVRGDKICRETGFTYAYPDPVGFM